MTQSRSLSGTRAEAGAALRNGLSRLLSNSHFLALADQAMVSAASFATTVMIGRWANAAELGAYVLAVSLLVSLQAVQESLVTLPYTILQRDTSRAVATHSGSALLLSLSLSILAAAVIAAVAAGLPAWGAEPGAVSLAWALCAVVPFVLLRELGRRFAFAHLRIAQATAIDAVAVVIQIVALVSLASAGALSAASACLALGAASGVGGVVWLYQSQGRIAFCADDARRTVGESWRLGRWLFVNQIIMQLQIYAPYWLTFLIAGSAATGVLSACVSVVLFASPFVTGLSNILTPKAVKAWRQGGGGALRRQAIHDAAILAAVTSAFGLFVFLFGEDMMAILYAGEAYRGLGLTVTTLAGALLAAALGLPPANALASIERPRPLVAAGLIGAVVTAALVTLLGWAWSLPGIAFGVFAGHLAGSLARWTALVAATRPDAGAS